MVSSKRGANNGVAKGLLVRVFLAINLMFAGIPAAAQSFFTSLQVDPAVGVDRGSTSRIQKVDQSTGFLTFTNNGAEEIGPYNIGLGWAIPQVLGENDQLDLVAVLSGPAADGSLELIAGGVGYRLGFPETGTTLIFNGDFADVRLGSEESLALGIKGQFTNFAVGLRREWKSENHSRLVASLEIAARSQHWQLLATPIRDESLRLLRASLFYSQGLPFGFQKKFGLSFTRGFDSFGASPVTNPIGSAPGVTTNFFRVAAGAEMSLPLSEKFYINTGVIAQWTDDSLPVSQRCGYQSNEYARGFDQAYVNGDRCLGSRIELAYNITLPARGAKGLSYSQAYLGVDGGVTEDLSNPVLTGRRDSWSSLSLGIRTLQGNFVGEVSVTHILDKPVGAFPQDETRIWFRTALRF